MLNKVTMNDRIDPYGIHWFRRDLRLYGNRALEYNLARNSGRVLGLFCFDRQFLERKDFSWNRFAFFLKTLEQLQIALAARGGELLCVDLPAKEWWREYFQQCRQEKIAFPSIVSWSRDYEPYARWRDDECSAMMADFQVKTHIQRDHLLVEPHELTKKNGPEGYQVFTPFARRWREIVQTPPFTRRIEEQKVGIHQLFYPGDSDPIFSLTWQNFSHQHALRLPQSTLLAYQDLANRQVTIALPATGNKAVIASLLRFQEKIANYQERRDFPAADANSGFSIYLKNGQLTIAQIMCYLQLSPHGPYPYFLNELIWREFYYHILWRQPQVEHQAFLEKFRAIQWPNNSEFFAAWKAGLTGFPIVDAGMRQLLATGLMHNRVRMVVASFLVKDLLVDWRWGERYFMEQLLDGDLAANNGGWQWCASTGNDPQPYFRIFNPWAQGKKFDPDGTYIKTYLPELKSRDVHQPVTGHPNYPAPIIQHHEQREQVMALYRSID